MVDKGAKIIKCVHRMMMDPLFGILAEITVEGDCQPELVENPDWSPFSPYAINCTPGCKSRWKKLIGLICSPGKELRSEGGRYWRTGISCVTNNDLAAFHFVAWLHNCTSINAHTVSNPEAMVQVKLHYRSWMNSMSYPHGRHRFT